VQAGQEPLLGTRGGQRRGSLTAAQPVRGKTSSDRFFGRFGRRSRPRPRRAGRVRLARRAARSSRRALQLRAAWATSPTATSCCRAGAACVAAPRRPPSPRADGAHSFLTLTGDGTAQGLPCRLPVAQGRRRQRCQHPQGGCVSRPAPARLQPRQRRHAAGSTTALSFTAGRSGKLSCCAAAGRRERRPKTLTRPLPPSPELSGLTWTRIPGSYQLTLVRKVRALCERAGAPVRASSHSPAKPSRATL
jgi:hypothetical protein